MDMSHDIVTPLLFFGSRNFELLRVQMLHSKRELPSITPDMHIARHTRLAFICSMASSVMDRPSSFSAMAKFSHSFLHVWKRFYNA